MLVVRVLVALSLVLFAGCGDEKADDKAEVVQHSLSVHGKFKQDAKGAPFFAQNLAKVHVPKATLAGADYLWVITKGGDTFPNADPLTAGGGKIKADLTFEITTDAIFDEAPYEFAMVISTSGEPNPPQAGDLASFRLDGLEEGDPPLTGQSIRFNVHDSDVDLSVTNDQFIVF